MRRNQACLKCAAGRKKCLRQRFHLSLALGRSSWRINAVCRAILAFCRAVSRTQSLSAICHYACRWWWHDSFMRCIEYLQFMQNELRVIIIMIAGWKHCPLKWILFLISLHLMITVIKILRQLYITRS